MRTRNQLLAIIILLMVKLSSFTLPINAHEGMWLISLIHKNIDEMNRLGLKLTAEDIYHVAQNSIKDAVVKLDDGGCTAGLISPKGLILTNHHCAISDIQNHSTSQNNLLEKGYWATGYHDELPVQGKTALVLQRIDDITDLVYSKADTLSPTYFDDVNIIISQIEQDAKGNERGVHAVVVPIYSHNKYYLCIYNRYLDVRLVGAPPSSIGNFGGDIENWRWPRHTGDFALYRLYADKKGRPASYSSRNVPLEPSHYFPISLEGIQEGDFTMVVGYPGVTHRYSTSHHAAHERDVIEPWVKRVWGQFIDDIKEAMETDEAIQLQMTDKYKTLVNFWQKDKYQAQSMRRFEVVERLKEREHDLYEWSKADSVNRYHYIRAMGDIETYYQFIQKQSFDELFRSLGALTHWPVDVASNIYEMHDLFSAMLVERGTKWKVRREARRLAKRLDGIFANYYPELDQLLYAASLVSLVESLPEQITDPLLLELSNSEHFDFFAPLLVEHFYSSSYFTSKDRMRKFLKSPNLDSLMGDPLFVLHISYETKMASIYDSLFEYTQNFEYASRLFVQGLLKMNEEQLCYPDANSTMRLSYGKVEGYSPLDGVWNNHVTYLNGKIAKGQREESVFKIDPKIIEIWEGNDYGVYADDVGLPICFITTNDITNGNSGSPILNEKGHLIGVAFDGNHEAMACDFMYESSMQRTIATDVRYMLFVIDRFAEALHLLEEMEIIYPDKK